MSMNLVFASLVFTIGDCRRRLALCLLLCLSLLSSHSLAQSGRGTISGSVVDHAGAALAGAQLQLTPLNILGVTSQQGSFTLPAVPAGSYTITVSYVGFEPQKTHLELKPGQSLNLDLKLTVASRSEEILVTADRPHGEAEAINQTRTADNIVQVLPSEVITSLPNANVADAIGRLPSVSLYRIEGEGVYIQVRGTEPRLTNVTVDGITIPSPEPTVRQVRLDVLPSDLIEAVELNKTLSANQDANGIGGSVNLRTKEAGDLPTLNLYGNGGFTNIENGRSSYGVGGTAGKRFGATKRFGILGNAAFDYNGRGIDNIQPSLDPLSTFAQPFYDNDTIREYRYYRYRYGFAGSADYRLSDNASVYAHGIYSDFKDWGDKWYYEPVSTPLSATGALPSVTAASPAPKFYTSSKRPNASVGALILGGRDARANSLLTWELSAARSYEVDSAGNPKADFSWIGPSVFCNYSPSAQQNPNRPTFNTCDANNSPLQNANLWAFKDITTSTGSSTQLNLTAATSYAHNYTLGSHFGSFETGFKFTNAHKTQDATETVYDGWSTKANSAVTMAQLQGDFSNTDYYNGSYFGGKYGPVSDFNKAMAYTLTNFKGFVDAAKTAAATYPNIFHTVERITAGYVMNTIDFGNLHVQTGLRFEGTQMDTFGYKVLLTPTGGIPTGVANNPSYLDVLPSVQLRYRLTPDSALRAVYARGVARPDAYQLVPYVTEDSTASPVAVSIGNPSLRPEHANNYDLLYENYLRPLGMIQAGFFFKQLNAPQLLSTLPGNLDLSNFPVGYFPTALQAVIEQYPGDAITQYVNGQNAYLYGFELSYQQHLSYLPGVLRNLGVSANYSYTASREKGVPLRNDHPTLIDQAPNTWNLSGTYDTKRFSLRTGLAYNGQSLFSYNWVSPTLVSGADPSGLGPRGPSGDVYTLTHFQVDAQGSYRLVRGLSAVVSGLNLNNEVFGYYTGSSQFINQREYYKPTITAGIRYNFQHER
ncbi:MULTISPECIES: TonB-dependent receptor [Acidobacteriaceae]|uniref:TonB-dependent receptor n=1 Tax=Acidobacteriaceae TaxID=204434 RepID=UPI00131AF413|nr:MULTISPECIES: TonB-dependent receptor [Acidobacteriaceae]MDW5266158.1 TonB-dependent receptor [Edaphobacter sp.]